MAKTGKQTYGASQEEIRFATLYEKTRRLVFGVAFAVTCNVKDAEEITQDTFVAAWERLREIENSPSAKNYLAKIAKNKAINFVKKRRRESLVDFTEHERLAGAYRVDEAAENSVVLAAAIKCLSEEEREIVLSKNAGLKTKEIAKMLDLPRGTVSWKYSRAIEKLRAEIEEKSSKRGKKTQRKEVEK